MGIATQALSQFLDQVRLRLLYAHVARHNIASIRVLEKCGFTICRKSRYPSATGDGDLEEFILQLGKADIDEENG